jgi:hypothetical protein
MRSRTIKRIPETDIVEIRYAGEVSYRYRIETLDELEAAFAGGRIRYLLVNYTSAWPSTRPEPAASQEFGMRLGRLPLAGDARIALLNAPTDVAAKTEEVVTPGGQVIRQFSERELAIAWLSGGTGMQSRQR